MPMINCHNWDCFYTNRNFVCNLQHSGNLRRNMQMRTFPLVCGKSSPQLAGLTRLYCVVSQSIQCAKCRFAWRSYGEVVTGHAVDGSKDAGLVAHGDWVDTAALGRLVDDTSIDVLPKIAKIMVSELHRHAANISIAAKAEDIPSLALASHVVKSSAASFGLDRLKTAAEQLNAACKTENLHHVQFLAAHLLTQIQPSIQALEQTCGIDRGSKP